MRFVGGVGQPNEKETKIMANQKKENATANTTTNKENKTMNENTTAIASATANTSIIADNGLKVIENQLSSLGYEMLKTDNYTFDCEKNVDGEKVNLSVTASDSEKRAIDEIYLYQNIATFSIPRQCALLAFMESKKTYENKGVTFKAYAKGVTKGKLSDGTIQKYANIGKCFFKPLENADSPVVWVDERLASMNDKHGVSVTNLDAILSTFRAYADNTEIDGASDYRDYVSSFIDEYCVGDNAKLHLEATLDKLREEIRTLNGKAGKAGKGKAKGKDSGKGGNNSDDKTLNPFDGLVNALTRYKDSDNTNKAILDKVNDLLALIEAMPETPEK